MKLLVDIGNQRVKWATSDQISFFDDKSTAARTNPTGTSTDQVIDTHSDRLIEDLSSQFEQLTTPDSVWVSCVSDDAAKSAIDKVCNAIWQIEPNYIRATPCAAGVRNGYENPAALGVDRWAALIAAKQLVGPQSTVVIDAGTAVTIDFLNNRSEFVGGVIFPGRATMIESLNAGTGQIKGVAQFAEEYQLQMANTDTRSAVINGVVLSVIAGIDHAIDAYQVREDKPLSIILTGGDAGWIAGLSKHTMQTQPDLVLTGILHLSEEAIL